MQQQQPCGDPSTAAAAMICPRRRLDKEEEEWEEKKATARKELVEEIAQRNAEEYYEECFRAMMQDQEVAEKEIMKIRQEDPDTRRNFYRYYYDRWIEEKRTHEEIIRGAREAAEAYMRKDEKARAAEDRAEELLRTAPEPQQQVSRQWQVQMAEEAKVKQQDLSEPNPWATLE